MANKKLVKFLSTLQDTNIRINDIINVQKVLDNVEDIKISLHTLDYIISNTKDEIIRKINILFHKEPKIFLILPSLIAWSSHKPLIIGKKMVNLDIYLSSFDNIIRFFELSGLFTLIINGKLNHFNDYFLGLEVGLDTNARKNRFGLRNEKDVEEIISNEIECYKYLTIHKQITGNSIEGICDISYLRNKKFDIVIKNTRNNKFLLLKSSFYNSPGSKLYETSRSYENIYNQIINLGNKYLFI